MKKQGNIEAFSSNQKYTNLAQSFLESPAISQNEINYFHLGVDEKDLGKAYAKTAPSKEELAKIPKFYTDLDGSIKDYNNGKELKESFEKINNLLTNMQKEHGDKSFTIETRKEIENIFGTTFKSLSNVFNGETKGQQIQTFEETIVKKQNEEIRTSLQEFKKNEELSNESKQEIDNLLKIESPKEFQKEVSKFSQKQEFANISDKNLVTVKSICNEGTKLGLVDSFGPSDDYAKVLDKVNKGVETFEKLSEKLKDAPTLLYSTTVQMAGDAPTKEEKQKALAKIIIEQQNITGLDPKQYLDQAEFKKKLRKAKIEGKIEIVFEQRKEKPEIIPTIVSYKITPQNLVKILKKTNFDVIPSGVQNELKNPELLKARKDVKELLETEFKNKTKLRERAEINQPKLEVKEETKPLNEPTPQQQNPTPQQQNPSIIFPPQAREILVTLKNEVSIKELQQETKIPETPIQEIQPLNPQTTVNLNQPEEKKSTGVDKDLEAMLNDVGSEKKTDEIKQEKQEQKEEIITLNVKDTIQSKNDSETLLKELDEIQTNFNFTFDDFEKSISQNPSSPNQSVSLKPNKESDLVPETSKEELKEGKSTQLAEKNEENKDLEHKAAKTLFTVKLEEAEEVKAKEIITPLVQQSQIQVINPDEKTNKSQEELYVTDKDQQELNALFNENTGGKPIITNDTLNKKQNSPSMSEKDRQELNEILNDTLKTQKQPEKEQPTKETPEDFARRMQDLPENEQANLLYLAVKNGKEDIAEALQNQMEKSGKFTDDEIGNILLEGYDPKSQKFSKVLASNRLAALENEIDFKDERAEQKFHDKEELKQKEISVDSISFDDDLDQKASNSPGLDEITAAIRTEILEKQHELLRNEVANSTPGDEEKAKISEMNPHQLREHLASEKGREVAAKVLNDKEVHKKLNALEVVGYKEVNTKFQASFKNVEWSPGTENTRSTQIKNAQGEPVADIKETTHSTNPISLTLADGTTKTVSSYRTIDFPKKLEAGKGPLHMSMAVKDENGKNIAAKDAVYFTAHYDDNGKLTEVSTPQPVKFMGEGKDAVGYIERDGKVFTLPVTQGKYQKMMKEVALNKGMGVDLSQKMEVSQDKIQTKEIGGKEKEKEQKTPNPETKETVEKARSIGSQVKNLSAPSKTHIPTPTPINKINDKNKGSLSR